VEPGRQPGGDLLPVGGRAGLPVQQHELVRPQPGCVTIGFSVSSSGGFLVRADRGALDGP
jgi:hypothetical protein